MAVELTDEQRAFVEHVGPVFLTACPGAGKTRSIVARVGRIVATLPPRRGVAVLSFTNTAVEEFRNRHYAEGLEAGAGFPSFIGTFDSFIWRFIAAPVLAGRSSERPTLIASWSDIGAEVRLVNPQALRGIALPLDAYDPITESINPSTLGNLTHRQRVEEHVETYSRHASRLRASLTSRGLYTADDARVLAIEALRDDVTRGALARAIAARFEELVVDEGQDCNQLDLEILEWLKAQGVAVTLVCDPDQSIYEFRNTTPTSLESFKVRYDPVSQLRLTGNFRSAPNICRVAATLRSSRTPDEALGEFRTSTEAVRLITYPGARPGMSVGRVFSTELSVAGISPEDAIVLAHAAKNAQRVVGVDAASSGSSRLGRLASAVASFASPVSSPRDRERALQRVERLLLEKMGHLQEHEAATTAMERHSIGERELRRLALNFLSEVPASIDDSDEERLDWIEAVQEQASGLGLSLPPGTTSRTFFRRPGTRAWSKPLHNQAKLSQLRFLTIHQAKGNEYAAVCLVIPPDSAPENRTTSLLDSWESNEEDEAKRVLYVGVTRAIRLVALAVHQSHSERVEEILSSNDIALEIIDSSSESNGQICGCVDQNDLEEDSSGNRVSLAGPIPS